MASYKKLSREEKKARNKARVDHATRAIVTRFEAGDLPKALAPVFIHRDNGAPCESWSWRNRLLTALEGFDDARTFLDWKRIGRNVKKGEHAFYILEPVRRTFKETDKESGEETTRTICRGFKPGARFGYEQTANSS